MRCVPPDPLEYLFQVILTIDHAPAQLIVLVNDRARALTESSACLHTYRLPSDQVMAKQIGVLANCFFLPGQLDDVLSAFRSVPSLPWHYSATLPTSD
jgi:hypothetical protein